MARYQPKGLPKGTRFLEILRAHLGPMHESRRKFIALYVMALVSCRTVDSRQLAAGFQSEAAIDSVMRRIERFFHNYVLDFLLLARAVIALAGIKPPVLLALDRTNWKFGSHHINVLTLSICLEHLSIPLLFRVLDHRGNSQQQLRIELLQQALCLFKPPEIECLVADREFVGPQWLTFLKQHQIPFCIRVKRNMRASTQANGRGVALESFFAKQPKQKWVQLDRRYWVGGVQAFVCGQKLDYDTYLILICSEQPEKAQSWYRRRWQIESAFKVLKTRGFHLESSHLYHPQRMHKLMTLLAVAAVWVYKTGLWQHKLKPIPLAKSLAKPTLRLSIFTLGLNSLLRWFMVSTEQNLVALQQSWGILSGS